MALDAAVIAANTMDKYIIRLYKNDNDIVFEPDVKWGNIHGNIYDQGDLKDLLSDKFGYDDAEIKETVSALEAKIDDINSDLSINHDKEKISSYTFTITDYVDDDNDYGFSSLCLPFDFDLPEDLKFISLYLEDSGGTLTQYNNGYYVSTKGRAHTPYIIGGKPGTYTVSGEYVEPFDSLTYLKTTNLRGTYKKIVIKASPNAPIYYISSGKIWKATKPITINPYRAYIISNNNQEWIYDTSLDEHSTNPIQNKYIKREFDNDREQIAKKVDKTELETKLNAINADIDKKIASAITDGEIDLDGYATVDYVDALGNNVVTNTNAITELSGKCENFVTLDEIPTILDDIMTESNYDILDVIGTKEDGSTITYKFLVKK